MDIRRDLQDGGRMRRGLLNFLLKTSFKNLFINYDAVGL